MNKRGMSPLIATVLLMAFAVALGGMIMNWSGDIGSESTIDCSAVTLSINKLCYSNNKIELNARNTGEKEIQELKIIIKNSAAEYTMNVADSKFNKGAPINKEIPAVIDNNTYIGLIPSIKASGEIISCEKTVAEKDPLPKC